MGVSFRRFAYGNLTMILRTPFQKVDHLLLAAECGRRSPRRPYGLDIWTRRKVYSATWDDADHLETRRLDSGAWVQTLFGLADTTTAHLGEIASRLAMVRVTHLGESEDPLA